MASEENSGDRVFQKGNGIDPFYASGWDQMVSLISSVVPQNQFVNAHYSVLGNQIMGSSSNLVHFPSDLEMLPKITNFGSGSFSEMVSSFGQIAESGSHSNFTQNNMVGIQRASNLKDHCENSENGVLVASANRRRKRKVSVGASPKNDEEAQQHDTTEFSKEDDEKKQKFEQNIGDQTVKQAKDNSTSAELPKEDYIHVRARRGQATNSHSLAERVRREKISERMRLLQELVPGCNKITGKAVMLDEIINYVQSLQQQVEFLSMKLATVNPELNMDIERILSKDILHSRGTALGNGLALSSSLPFSAYPHRTFSNAPGTTSSFPLPHNTWNNNELQSILQLGFDTVHSVSSLGPSGMSKMQP